MKSISLENRITRLEKQLLVNENYDKNKLGEMAMRAIEAAVKSADLVSQIRITLDNEGGKFASNWKSIEDDLNNIIIRLNKLGFKL